MRDNAQKTRTLTPEQVDALLPQTQCGLCGYGGCMPYAEALVFEKAAINLCPPGGVETLQALGSCLQIDPTPFVAEMEKKTKPLQIAVIREAECIGCVKCINACPVDAILGSAKMMHTVIADACTGCELCIAPCPVDCIDLLPIEKKFQNSAVLRERFKQRESRLLREKSEKQTPEQKNSSIKRKRYIEEALLRAKQKKAHPSK